MVTYEYSKDVNLDRLVTEISAAGLSGLKSVESSGGITNINFENALISGDVDILNTVVTNHSKVISTDITANIMKNALSFSNELIKSFAAENIAMGITQAGKTAEVLSVLTNKYNIPSLNRPISLYECLISGSLYPAIDILNYLIDNPAEYDGLDPFLTVERLTIYKVKIQTYLGI